MTTGDEDGAADRPAGVELGGGQVRAGARRDAGAACGPVLVVTVAGELDYRVAAPLYDWVAERAAGGPGEARRVVLDLADVGFCDSAGLNTLIRVWRLVHGGAGRDLVLAAVPPSLRELLASTGLDAHIARADSAAGALALAPGGR
ncbi:STAS domain-containing protein [Actinomadura parmotrematis]|uniref:STAS domain-containing protein n=1 Tax=Actinomadura parmotrematis TaxID=2864039 RepID=A0ABS7G1L4_9ACTN|nr:STAS domain-containing protein [Actinomadura parmotrematis]MBW8485727.1 STAS domain-containing protein [Actinomadura parmotrematis]